MCSIHCVLNIDQAFFVKVDTCLSILLLVGSRSVDIILPLSQSKCQGHGLLTFMSNFLLSFVFNLLTF